MRSDSSSTVPARVRVRVPVHLAILAAIMLGGLLWRLVFLAGSAPSGGWPLVLDEGNYVGLAEPLSRGEGLVEKWAWVRPPGYPAFIALFLLPGWGLPAAALAQILLSVANIGLLYALAVEVLDMHGRVQPERARAAGLMAAGLLALNPHAAFYSSLLMPEPLYMLAITLMAWSLLVAVRLWRADGPLPRRSLALVALGAAMAAWAIYLRSALQTFVPLLLVWLVWVLPRRQGAVAGLRPRLSRRALLAPLLFVAVLAAAILPWTLRNYLTYDRFMLMDAVGGLNLWQYNGDLSRQDVLSRLLEIPNPVDRDRYATEQGVRAILEHPARFASDAALRFSDAWPVEYFSELWQGLRNKYPGIDCTYLDLFSWASTLFYVPFGLLAIAGFAMAPGRAFKGLLLLFLLHYALTTMFAHNEFRYRLPLYPWVGVYAGWGALRMLERLRGGRARHKVREGSRHIPIGAWVAAAVALLFVVQCAAVALPGLAKSVRYQRRYIEGKSALMQGDYAAALSGFLGAAQIDQGCACLYRNIGIAQGKLGRPDEERAAYTTALQREEYDWRTAALLSHQLRSTGSPRAADAVRHTRPEYRSRQQEWAWDNLEVAPASELDVGGADIGYVRGWEALEQEGETSYRWSTGRSALKLTPPEGQERLVLKLRWHSLAWPGKPDPEASVRVLVGGREAGVLTVQPGWHESTLDLEEGAGWDKRRSLVVELLTDATRPPGGEQRRLGVAVDRVSVVRDNR